ncbi:MAG: hypothetical protein ACI9EF_001065 [Pseudohongiellaceae bacterium]
MLTEAIEDAFVPLAIHNNKPGPDKVILEQYNEPAWNNPVVRFFAPGGQELLSRKDHVWEAAPLAARMIDALAAKGDSVPGYLRIAHEELSAGPVEQIVFSMACFWKGEALYGGLSGVAQTRAGWLDGREVVEVLYNPEQLSLTALLQAGLADSCANKVWVSDAGQLATAKGIMTSDIAVVLGGADDITKDAKVSDRKFYLGRSPARWLPLTPLQATRINAQLESAAGQSLADALGDLLSPKQVAWLARIESKLGQQPSAFDGLQRPDTVGALSDYENDLELRLSAAP